MSRSDKTGKPGKPARPGQRRALSATRREGRVNAGGDPVLGRELVAALTAAQREHRLSETLTHPFHSYPARMHPATARHLIAVLDPRSVLDPFCGSGTTLVEARAAGIASTGVDINPLAIAIARAKTWTAPKARRRALDDRARSIAAEALAEGKAARRAGWKPPPHRPNPQRDQALRGWFDPHVRRELETLARLIDPVAREDGEIAEILRAALSSVLYKVSRRSSDTDTRQVQRHIARGAAARLFRDRIALLLSGLDDMTAERGQIPRLVLADARELPADLGTFGAVVTSPPYAGTYDYVEQHRLRMAFLGIDERAMEQGEIASRRSFAGDPALAQRRVERDLGAALGQAARAVPAGPIALVIGDSVAGGRAVAADALVRTAVGDRLEVVAWAWQERPKVGDDRRVFGARLKREHVIVLGPRRP